MFFWDHETESFWSQMTGACLVGPSTGKKLKWIATQLTTWGDWRKQHPKSTVLAPVMEMKRYRGSAQYYNRYRNGGRPIPHFLGRKVTVPKTYKPMDTCTILVVNGKGRCYPHPALKEGANKDGALTITKTGKKVVVTDKDGKVVPTLAGYWFSFPAFYPDGTVWKPKQAEANSKPR